MNPEDDPKGLLQSLLSGYRRVRENPIGDFLMGFTPPGVVADVEDAGRAIRNRDLVGLGLAGIGFVPGVGDVAKGAGKAIRRAVSDLPMDEASRLARARDMGFDVDRTLYRGTVNRGEMIPRESFEAGGGIFTTDNPDVAEIFRYPREFGEVLTERYDNAIGDYVDIEPGDLQELYVNRGRSFVVNDPERFTYDTSYQSRVIDSAKKQGFDTIEVPNVREGVGDWTETGTTVVVLNPANVRSTAARFDPTQRESANLLAGLAGLFGAGTAARMMNQNREER